MSSKEEFLESINEPEFWQEYVSDKQELLEDYDKEQKKEKNLRFKLLLVVY